MREKRVLEVVKFEALVPLSHTLGVELPEGTRHQSYRKNKISMDTGL